MNPSHDPLAALRPYKVLPRPTPWADGYTHDVWLFGVRLGAFRSLDAATQYAIKCRAADHATVKVASGEAQDRADLDGFYRSAGLAK